MALARNPLIERWTLIIVTLRHLRIIPPHHERRQTHRQHMRRVGIRFCLTPGTGLAAAKQLERELKNRGLIAQQESLRH
jgi:hypothetical protein